MNHIETKHPEEASWLLEEQHPREGFDDVRLNIMDEMHTDDPGNLPPASTPISIDTIEYHPDGPQPDNIDQVDMHRQSEYLNSYTAFLDEDEFNFVLRLVKHGIRKIAIDNIMALGPVSLPPRGGPWELLVVAVGVPDSNRDMRTGRRLQVCLVPSSGSSWVVNT